MNEAPQQEQPASNNSSDTDRNGMRHNDHDSHCLQSVTTMLPMMTQTAMKVMEAD